MRYIALLMIVFTIYTHGYAPGGMRRSVPPTPPQVQQEREIKAITHPLPGSDSHWINGNHPETIGDPWYEEVP